jgi:hypothetical protein
MNLINKEENDEDDIDDDDHGSVDGLEFNNAKSQYKTSVSTVTVIETGFIVMIYSFLGCSTSDT